MFHKNRFELQQGASHPVAPDTTRTQLQTSTTIHIEPRTLPARLTLVPSGGGQAPRKEPLPVRRADRHLRASLLVVLRRSSSAGPRPGPARPLHAQRPHGTRLGHQAPSPSASPCWQPASRQTSPPAAGSSAISKRAIARIVVAVAFLACHPEGICFCRCRCLFSHPTENCHFDRRRRTLPLRSGETRFSTSTSPQPIKPTTLVRLNLCPAIAYLECSRCHHHVSADTPQTLCPLCAGSLYVRYDMDKLKQTAKREASPRKKPPPAPPASACGATPTSSPT